MPDMASISQQISKKDIKLEQSTSGKSFDIRVENFDVCFGEKVLLQNASLLMSFGRRYGMVGRNGLGKTTLLRAMSRYKTYPVLCTSDCVLTCCL